MHLLLAMESLPTCVMVTVGSIVKVGDASGGSAWIPKLSFLRVRTVSAYRGAA